MSYTVLHGRLFLASCFGMVFLLGSCVMCLFSMDSAVKHNYLTKVKEKGLRQNKTAVSCWIKSDEWKQQEEKSHKVMQGTKHLKKKLGYDWRIIFELFLLWYIHIIWILWMQYVYNHEKNILCHFVCRCLYIEILRLNIFSDVRGGFLCTEEELFEMFCTLQIFFALLHYVASYDSLLKVLSCFV